MLTLKTKFGSSPVARSRGDDAIAEQYYSLVHWLRPVGDMSAVAIKTVGIAGCASGVGSSTVAANLAVAAAETSELPVLLLDLSSTQSSIATRFGMRVALGLRESLAEVARTGELLKPSPIANLSVLAVNEPGIARPLDVDCARVHELLPALERDFGLIVVDLPHIESSACFGTAGLLNGVVLVMEAEHTQREAAARAKQRLIHAQANVLGAILNNHRRYVPHWLDARLK